MEEPFAGGINDFAVEHEVLLIGLGDQDALRSIETAGLAKREEAFDLLIHATDGLDLAPLVDRSGHGEALVDGYSGKGREDGVEFG